MIAYALSKTRTMNFDLSEFDTARVLVLGDVMLDRYWHGATTRISPEAPVPVVRVTDTEARAGGAANVAANISALGAAVTLSGVVGDDEAARVLADLMQAHGVDYQPLADASRPTVSKMRVMSRHQQLMRLDFEEIPGDDKMARRLMARFAGAIGDYDVAVLSDYAKGTVSATSGFMDAARERGVRVLVDPKGRDFGRYQGAFCLTPNRGEFEAVVGACASDAEVAARGSELCRDFDFAYVLVTRGEEGMSLVARDGSADHLQALAREVFDVTGAGDTVIAVFATALAAGHAPARAMQLANMAAGLVVARLGTAVVQRAALAEALNAAEAPSLTAAPPVVDHQTLVAHLTKQRLAGHRIVMTNGCFDLLHAGHVQCLEEARALGDCLIVAVNDDASVARLKGPTRPLTPLAQRMAVLGALRAVDLVVAFSEDTPAKLIDTIMPDVLVKGGDYTPETIVGADVVLANGGEVKVVPLHAGLSTTGLIAAATSGGPA